MRKRLIEKLTRAKKGSLGYTMTELLVVIGIIAVTCAIAIPSIFAIRDALRFATANNYAKSIFLAAQQNLTELRSDGGLTPVQSASGAYVIPDEVTTFPDEFRAEYHKRHCFMDGKTGYRHVQLITYDENEHPVLKGETIDMKEEDKRSGRTLPSSRAHRPRISQR